ncbi:unnamed protein product, partial [Prorocentrum cordatum]
QAAARARADVMSTLELGFVALELEQWRAPCFFRWLASPRAAAGRRHGGRGSAAGLGAGGGRTAGRAHARAAAPHAAQAQAGAHRQAGDGVVPDGPGGPQGGGEQLGRVGLWGAAGGEPLGRLPRRAAGRGLLGRSGALRGRG